MQILRPIQPADKPLPPALPGSWESWAVALIYALFQASERRVRRLEELNRGLSAEIDRLRRTGGERRRAA